MKNAFDFSFFKFVYEFRRENSNLYSFYRRFTVESHEYARKTTEVPTDFRKNGQPS